MKKNQKAKYLLYKDRIIKEGENDFYELWFVKGLRHINYQVSYSKTKKTYNCTCKNIRNTDCYHIEGVKLKKRILNLED
jgi:hypothetical protein